jgi:hypothetical protein
MSRVHLLGQLPLALQSLSNEGLKEVQEIATLFGAENGPAWIAHLRKTRKAGLPDLGSTAVRKEQLLVNRQQYTIAPPKKPLDLDAFFTQCTGFPLLRVGIYPEESFSTRASSYLKTVEPRKSLNLVSYDLADEATDSEIRSQLPENHETEEYLWAIAEMIRTRKSGKKGLLKDRMNIFYLPGLAVLIHWDLIGARWCFYAQRPGERSVPAYSRVFCLG